MEFNVGSRRGKGGKELQTGWNQTAQGKTARERSGGKCTKDVREKEYSRGSLGTLAKGASMGLNTEKEIDGARRIQD